MSVQQISSFFSVLRSFGDDIICKNALKPLLGSAQQTPVKISYLCH